MDMRVVDTEGMTCPVCGAPEHKIRWFKVHVDDRRGWESECMRCHAWIPERGKPKIESREAWDLYRLMRSEAKRYRVSLKEMYDTLPKS